MSDAPRDLRTAVFVKTALGQQEIQSRSLRLTPIVRRVLVLVDGHRSGKELAAFVPGNEIDSVLTQLMIHGCIDAQTRPVAPTVRAT